MRKLLSILTALSLFIPTIAVIADDPSATTEPEKEIRVVGKRITGDDTYFEISLELDRDYEEYSAVGVVLEYDPTVIWPAESWDDGAGKADMDGIDSWSTRRALPTLGKDTWTTHTALTYIRPKDETDPDNIIPAKGYLYLGAEYPGTTPNTVDPSATTDPAATPAATPETTPAASPAEETETDPYSNPIVVARFMYVGDDPAATKAALVSAWETGANVTPTAETWDKHWQQNEILTLAGDDIAEKSPGEYAGAVYFADYSKKVYMHTFPSPAPTAAPESTLAPGATPTPLPTFAPYTPPAVGSGLTADEKLTADKIEIVTGEGESAKAGGLKLSDIYVILFYDWDDTLIGSITGGLGAEGMNEAVSNYVKEKFIYPDLRTPGPAEITSKARTDTYRGEYPHTGPDSALKNTPGGAGAVSDGENYPLTNKLDYVFAGKDFYENAPFAGGWTRVIPNDIDYDAENKAAIAAGNPEPYPGNWAKILPHDFDKTFTALTTAQTYGKTPLLDSSGIIVDDSGTPLSPQPAVPTYCSYDFSNVQETDLDGGVLYVKAVYLPGTLLNTGGTTVYSAIGKMTIDAIKVPDATSSIFSAKFQYRRVNASGMGVQRTHEPKIKMDFTQTGATGEAMLPVSVPNKDVMDIELLVTNSIKEIKYALRETYQTNVNDGAVRSAGNELGTIKAEAADNKGFIKDGTRRLLIKQVKDYIAAGETASAWSVTLYEAKTVLELKTATNGNFTALTVKNATTKNNLRNLINNAEAASMDPYDLTLAQIQYGIRNSGSLVSDSTAKSWLGWT